MRSIWKLFITVSFLIAMTDCIKTTGRKGNKIGQRLIKVPETLSTSATSYDDYASFNLLSEDPHHVSYIAANRLYYHRIPHQRIVLNQEDIREMNGLPRHLLESIRPFFPFFIDY